jgi:hypothetical protein
VAARKKRPVLYEVYRPRAKITDPTRKAPSFSDVRDGLRTSPTDEGEAAVWTRREGSFRPAAQTAAGRWQVAISAPTLAVLVAALAVLLAVAFSAGRRYESLRPGTPGAAELTPADEDLAQANAEQTAPVAGEGPGDDQASELVASETPAPERASDAESRAADTKPRQIPLLKGHHYVIIQHFRKQREHQAALAAAQYLQENGVTCARLSGADIRLIATEPFLIKQDDKDAARRERERAEQFIQRIRGLGQQYNKKLANEGKPGYTFAGCKLFEIK